MSTLEEQQRAMSARYSLAAAAGWVADRAPYGLLSPVSLSFVDEVWPRIELRASITPYPWVVWARCEPVVKIGCEPQGLGFVVEWRHVLKTQRHACLAAPDPKDSMWWIAARIREAVETLAENIKKEPR